MHILFHLAHTVSPWRVIYKHAHTHTNTLKIINMDIVSTQSKKSLCMLDISQLYLLFMITTTHSLFILQMY